MKERVGGMIGQAVEGMPWLGTFHAIGVKILRRHAELVGLKSDFTILDADDQIRLLKQLLAAEHIDEKRWPARVLAGLIDHWKNRGLTPDQVPAGEASAFANGKGKKLYQAFQERLKVLNAADFGDLLLECIRLFRENSEVLAQYQRRFKFILVDEYQDTNVAQYLWLRLIAQRAQNTSSPKAGGLVLRDAALRAAPQDEEQARHLPQAPSPDPHPEERGQSPSVSKGEAEVAPQPPKNICCVGDDDQSIYGWRGAEVDNILRFDHDFPGAKVIRLERNYRSTGHILAAASHLIAHNEGRLGKTLRTEDVPGEKVTVTGSWDSEEEARSIGEEIEELQRGGHILDEIAILVRASYQMREFEDRFVTLGLPYRVIGGPRFYERAEIRDAHGVPSRHPLAGRRPRLRAHRQRAQARARRRHHPGAARLRPQAARAADRGRARGRRDRRAEAQAAQRAARRGRQLRPLARAEGHDAAQRAGRDRARRERLHRDVAARQKRRRRRPPGEPQGAGSLHGGVREPRGLPRAHLAGDGRRERRGRGQGQHHDHALGQGAGVRHRVPAGLGGRPVPEPAHARRAGPRRPRGGAPPRPRRADPRAASAPRSTSPPTAAPTACGRPTSRRASSTNCRRPTSR